MSHVDRIARLKIELDDWCPVIWRRVDVPLTASLKALHDVIQAVMPFENYHLFEFRADGKRYAIPDPEWDSLRVRTFSARTTKLGALVDRGVARLSYTYDFGDDWWHTVTVEAVFAADPGRTILDTSGAPGAAHRRMSAESQASSSSSTPWPIPTTSSTTNSCAGTAAPSIQITSMTPTSRPGSPSSPGVAPSARPRSPRAEAWSTDQVECARGPRRMDTP